MPELDDIEEKSNGRRWRKYSRIDIDREINNNRDSREFEKIRYHHQFKRNKKVLWSSKYFIPISIPNYLNPPTRHPPLLIPRYPIDHGRPQFDLLFNFNYSSSIRARFKRKHRPFSSPLPSPLSPYRTLFPATHMRNTVLARITVACPDKPTTPYNCPSLSSVYRSPTIIVTISFRIIQPNGQWLYRRKLLPRSTWTHAPPPSNPYGTVLRSSPFVRNGYYTVPRLHRSLNFPSGHVSRISKSHLIEISNEPRVRRSPSLSLAHPLPPTLHLQGATRMEGGGKKWAVDWKFIRGGLHRIAVRVQFFGGDVRQKQVGNGRNGRRVVWN